MIVSAHMAEGLDKWMGILWVIYFMSTRQKEPQLAEAGTEQGDCERRAGATATHCQIYQPSHFRLYRMAMGSIDFLVMVLPAACQ